MQLEVRRVAISRKLIITIVVVLAVVAAGLLGWFIYKNSSGWTAYDNPKYGYSLRHPKNWVLNKTHAEEDFRQGVGGELIMSNYENSTAKFESQNPPADLMAMRVVVYKISTSTTLDDLLGAKAASLLQAGATFTKNNISLNGLEGVQFIYQEPDSPKNIVFVKTVLKNSTNMFVLTFNYLGQETLRSAEYQLPAAVASIHDTILNSFKLK